MTPMRSLMLLALCAIPMWASCATPLPRPTPKPGGVNEVISYQRSLAARIKEIKQDDPGACLIDEGGCGERAFSPAPCEGEVGIAASSGLPDGFEQYEATSVVIRGKLTYSFACTLLYCEDACCNGCGGQLELELMDGRRVELEPSLAHTDAFRCVGDESMACCGYKPDGRIVVAAGSLTSREGAPPTPRIINATLCTP